MSYVLAEAIVGEPAFSRVLRSAPLNSCDDGQQLLDDLLIPARKLRVGDDGTLQQVALLFGVPREELRRNSPRLVTTTRTWELNGEILDERHLHLSSRRTCPLCQDKRGDDVSGVVLIQHQIPVVTACLEHRVLLTESARCDAVSVESVKGSRYLLARLGLDERDPVIVAPLLDAMTWRAAARAIRSVGAGLIGFERGKDPAASELHEIMEAGFSALRSADFLRQALDVIINKAAPAKEIGAIRAYGPQILSLSEGSMAEEAKPFNIALQSHAAEYLPPRTGRPAANPEGVHTIVAAAKQLDIHPKTLGLILKTYEQPAFFTKHRLISRTVFQDLQRRLADTMNQSEMFQRVGLTEAPGKAIVKTGVLKPIYPSDRHKRTYSARDVEQVILKLAGNCPVVDRCPSRLASIPQCAAKIRRSMVSIVKLVDAGQLDVMAKGPALRFDQLYVDPARVRSALFGETKSAGVTRRAAERRLRTTGQVIDALIREGLLAVVVEDAPIPRSTRTVVLDDSIADFETRFIMSREIVARTGLSFRYVKRELEKFGLSPADLPNVPATIFEREPFEALIAYSQINVRDDGVSQT